MLTGVFDIASNNNNNKKTFLQYKAEDKSWPRLALPDASKYTVEPLQGGGKGVQPKSEGSNGAKGRWDK